MASAHIYRDALRWKDAGGRARRALLLCPSDVGACKDWFHDDFHRKHGAGVAVLRPGEGQKASLGRRLWEALNEGREEMA